MPKFLECTVEDRSGEKGPLKDALNQSLTMVFFLRHFGCIACSEHVQEVLGRLSEFRRWDVGLVFVGNGAPHYIDGFIARNSLKDKNVAVYTDPTLNIFKEAGLHRSVWKTMGPKAMLNALKFFGKGFGQTSVEGDSFQQGGVFLVEGGEKILFEHRSANLGDREDLNDLFEVVQKRGCQKARPEQGIL